MNILFTTDLHGDRRKYDMLFEAAKSHKADIVVNGGDMLPKYDLFNGQRNFIINYLEKHFLQFEQAGIYYLCYLSNDDLRIHDDLLVAGFCYIEVCRESFKKLIVSLLTIPNGKVRHRFSLF